LISAYECANMLSFQTSKTFEAIKPSEIFSDINTQDEDNDWIM